MKAREGLRSFLPKHGLSFCSPFCFSIHYLHCQIIHGYIRLFILSSLISMSDRCRDAKLIL